MSRADASTAVATQPPRPRMPPWQHMAGLDGLRGLAVIAVLVFHAGYLQGGFLGVDLFFALSGFLITSLLLREAPASGIRLGAFWGRRARRLLPGVLAMLVTVAMWAAAFGSPADLDGVRRDGPWALFYVANWHFIAQAGGYWQSFSQPSMLDHLWSLAIEEQFYLLWPLALVGIWRWSRRPHAVLFLTCVAGLVASFGLMLLLYHGGDPTRVYMGTDTRAASVLAGALAATAPARRAATALVRLLGDATTGLIVVVGGFVLWSWAATNGANSATLYRGGLLAHSLACALVVLLVATAPATAGSRALGWRPLAWVGVLSYGLYLWHWPVYVVLSPERTGLGGPALLLPRLAVSTALAVASYHIVENPIRRHATWARTRRGVPVLVTSVAAVALVFGLLPTPATEIAGFDPAAVNAAGPPTSRATGTAVTAAPSATAPASPATTAPAAPAPAAAVAPPTTPAPTPPPTTAPPPPTTVPPPPQLAPITQAVWAGDSIAYDMSPAVKAALKAANIRVDVGAAYVGLRLGNPDKYTSMRKLVRLSMQKVGADTVIMQLSVWDAPLSEAEQADALARLRDFVLANGARLVIVAAPIGPDPQVNDGAARMAAIAQGMAASDPIHVVFLDPSVVWGPTAVLDLDGDGTPERKRDLTHVCPSGAARFADWLTAALATRFAGMTPAPPTAWAVGTWVTDPRYDQPVGTCAPVG